MTLRDASINVRRFPVRWEARYTGRSMHWSKINMRGFLAHELLAAGERCPFVCAKTFIGRPRVYPHRVGVLHRPSHVHSALTTYTPCTRGPLNQHRRREGMRPDRYRYLKYSQAQPSRHRYVQQPDKT